MVFQVIIKSFDINIMIVISQPLPTQIFCKY